MSSITIIEQLFLDSLKMDGLCPPLRSCNMRRAKRYVLSASVLQQFIDMDSFKARAIQLSALDKTLRRQDVYKRLILNEYNARAPKGNKLKV